MAIFLIPATRNLTNASAMEIDYLLSISEGITITAFLKWVCNTLLDFLRIKTYVFLKSTYPNSVLCFLKETSMWIVCNLRENIFQIFSSDLLQPFKRQPHKMVKQTQTILRQQPTNCLNVYDHFVRLSWTHAKKTFMRSPN